LGVAKKLIEHGIYLDPIGNGELIADDIATKRDVSLMASNSTDKLVDNWPRLLGAAADRRGPGMGEMSEKQSVKRETPM